MDPTRAAEALRAAMRGAGTNDTEVIRVLGPRSYQERMAIVDAYRARFARSLKDDLHSETSGNYRRLLEALVTPRPNVIAQAIFDACAGIGTDDYQLITLITQFDLDLPAVIPVYKTMFRKDLVATVKSETSGHYEDVLVNLLLRRPPPLGYVNAATVPLDAKAFYQAGEGRRGTNDKEYIRIMTTNSQAHLLAVAEAYRSLSPKGMRAAIESETSGNYRQSLLSLLTPHHRWMAQAVHHAIEGAGTEDAILVFVFALHDKPDLQLIAREYRTLYQKDMMTDVKKDISGNYERLCFARLQ